MHRSNTVTKLMMKEVVKKIYFKSCKSYSDHVELDNTSGRKISADMHSQMPFGQKIHRSESSVFLPKGVIKVYRLCFFFKKCN